MLRLFIVLVLASAFLSCSFSRTVTPDAQCVGSSCDIEGRCAICCPPEKAAVCTEGICRCVVPEE